MTFNVGDWVHVLDDNSDYAYTKTGAIGVVLEVADTYVEVDWEADTLSQYWREDNGAETVFAVGIDDVALCESPSSFITERHAAREERIAVVKAKLEAERIARDREDRLNMKRRYLRERMSLAQLHYNSQFYPRGNFVSLRKHGRKWGKAIAEALREEDVGELIDALNNLPENARQRTYNAIENSDMHSGMVDEVHICVDCDRACHDDDSSYIEVNDHGTVCYSCREDYYIYSDCMGQYIHHDDSERVFYSVRAYNNGDPDDYCTGRFGRNNLVSWQGEFVDEETYQELDDEYNGNDDDEGLRDYHSTSRYFTEQSSVKGVPALGVELEVYSESRGTAVKDMRNTMPSDWIYERDGSLDSSYGFEVVTQPYGHKEWLEHAPLALETLREADTVAYTAPRDHQYGIHVNIHRRHLTPLQEARILMFLVSKTNRDFVTAIAQRSRIYGSSAVQVGSKTNPKVKDIGNLYRKKIEGLNRYSPLNLNHSVAEFRIFQSTLHTDSFIKNLEFVWALVEWTSTKAATGVSSNHVDFIKWLGASSERVQRYSYLVAFLRKPSFRVADDDNLVIKNQWQEFMPKATSSSRAVVTGDTDLRIAA